MNTSMLVFFNLMLTTARTEESKRLFQKLLADEKAEELLTDPIHTNSSLMTPSPTPDVGMDAKRGLQWFGIGTYNRRKFMRYSCILPVVIHQDSPGQVSVMNAVAQNISSGGMLIKCSAVLNSLSQCYVLFKIPEWLPSANRACEVMNFAQVQRTDPLGQYYVVAFMNPL